MIFFILIWIPKIKQQKISLYANRQLCSLYRDGSKIRSLTACIFLRFVHIINGLSFNFLIDKFPEGTRFNSFKKFTIFFRYFFITYNIRYFLLINYISLIVVPVFPASFDYTWSYLLVLGTFLSRIVPLPGWYPIGFLSILKTL